MGSNVPEAPAQTGGPGKHATAREGYWGTVGMGYPDASSSRRTSSRVSATCAGVERPVPARQVTEQVHPETGHSRSPMGAGNRSMTSRRMCSSLRWEH